MNTSSYNTDTKGRFMKGYTHERFYPKTPGETSNLYVHLYRHFKKTGKWLSGYQLLCTTCNWIKFVRGSCTPDYHKKLSVPQQISGVI